MLGSTAVKSVQPQNKDKMQQRLKFLFQCWVEIYLWFKICNLGVLFAFGKWQKLQISLRLLLPLPLISTLYGNRPPLLWFGDFYMSLKTLKPYKEIAAVKQQVKSLLLTCSLSSAQADIFPALFILGWMEARFSWSVEWGFDLLDNMKAAHI